MLPRVLLFLVVCLPALAVSSASVGGRTVFVLYREPKGVVAVCGVWLLVAVLAWTRPGLFRLDELRRTVRRPAVALGLALGVWLAVTGLWVRVPENWLVEMFLYVSFGWLFVVLVTWFRREAGVADVVRWGLATSLGLVTAVGVWQWAGLPLPFSLPPIRPEIGAGHPSFLGWKNPAALAVTGQIFVLASLARRRDLPARLRIGLWALLALETVYVASLGSRTALLALGAGLAVVVLGSLPGDDIRRRRSLWTAGGLVLAFVFVIGAVAATDADLRQRLGTLLDYAASPSSYLASDRGVYLRNTLVMARHEPLGVGLGDWQTAYPVYRLHGRSVAFDDTFEVRRAHSDHVQMLGEAGWPGLALWLAWLGALVAGPARAALSPMMSPMMGPMMDSVTDAAGGRVDSERLLTAAQVVALAAAMATDYVVEMPYGRFQLFLVAALAVAGGSGGRAGSAGWGPAPADGSNRRRRVGALLFGIAALSVCGQQVLHLQRAQLGAEIERRTEAALGELGSSGRVERARLEGILDLGERFRELPAVSKTAYRTHLALGQVDLLLGRPHDARRSAVRALRLHPYSVDAMAFMARVVDEPCAAAWREARRFVVEEATRGFGPSSSPSFSSGGASYPECGTDPP